MARRVFFSFHYADIMNANIVRNSGQFKPTAETGFYDSSLWESAKTKGDATIQRLINRGMDNTSVTCFLIGMQTYNRKWCKYELRKSVSDSKGILGILLPNQNNHGPYQWVLDHGMVYNWDHNYFEKFVEKAAKDAGR